MLDEALGPLHVTENLITLERGDETVEPALPDAREASLLGSRRAMAERDAINPESIENIFQTILHFSHHIQR